MNHKHQPQFVAKFRLYRNITLQGGEVKGRPEIT